MEELILIGNWNNRLTSTLISIPIAGPYITLGFTKHSYLLSTSEFLK